MKPLVRRRRHHAVRRRVASVPLDDPMDRERAGERTAVVEPMDQIDDIVEPLGERCRFEMMTVDELRSPACRRSPAVPSTAGPMPRSAARASRPRLRRRDRCRATPCARRGCARRTRHGPSSPRSCELVMPPCSGRMRTSSPSNRLLARTHLFDVCPLVHNQRCSTSSTSPRRTPSRHPPLVRLDQVESDRSSTIESTRFVCRADPMFGTGGRPRGCLVGQGTDR